MKNLESIIDFLNELTRRKIYYRLEHNRDEAIMVLIAVPGQRWEIEFFKDGSIEIERFISTGEIEDKSVLEELFSKFSD